MGGAIFRQQFAAPAVSATLAVWVEPFSWSKRRTAVARLAGLCGTRHPPCQFAGGSSCSSRLAVYTSLQGDALRELARQAVLVLGQAGSELHETGAAPATEEPFVALDAIIQDSLQGDYFRLTQAALDAAEPFARALQQLWEQQRQALERHAALHVRIARAAALRPCANL